MKTGRAIKLLRTARGLTQKDLATTVECSANYLSLVEREDRTPSIPFLEKVAEALNVPPSHILALAEDYSRIDDPVRRDLLIKLRELVVRLMDDEGPCGANTG